MKISELIEKLQEIEKDYGNVDVTHAIENFEDWVFSVEYLESDGDIEEHVLIC